MILDLPKIEEKILKFWERKKIFEKSLEKTKKGPRFVFFEGPPFANGLPGIHHLVSRAFKDIILRYKTMQGFYVERRAGWDTHGLPTEMEAEKKLGIKSKKDIEKIGIDKFIEECRRNVFTYKKEWEEFSRRIGFWLDFENAYITCSNDYIESLWWILKQIWEKGLLYQDYKVVHYCPRCGTSLSSHEVAQGYKTIKENSIYVKLRVKGKKNNYLLIWTTTPWTLPGNTAVAINPKLKYVKAKIGSDYLILAKERLGILNKEYKIAEELNSRDLLGTEYEPLYDFIKPDKKAYYVVAGDFVSLDEGTGLVHMAPAFGEDDMRVAKENNLPVLMTVDEEGKFKSQIKNWAGKFVKDSDPLIVENLKNRNLLFSELMYEHEYPFCWRCKTPLLYYAKNSWFIKMTAVKKELIENNKKIKWVPEYIKEGRFGEWLREVKDWNLSRERYWGTPLPVWLCQTGKSQIPMANDQKNCRNIKVIGSINELEKLSGEKIKEVHRPFIDKITFKCDKCGGEMKRVEEVIDCWFDSGCMPFGQWHYPFENKNKIENFLPSHQSAKGGFGGDGFPADFICEGIDQTRGWFYTLLAVSTSLGLGPSYKNVISNGLVLDASGQKMSKSKGNIIVPSEVINKYGVDCCRMYFYTVNSVAEPKRFDFKDVEYLYRKFFDTLWQSYSFFSIYSAEKFKPKEKFNSKNLLDKWIVSRLENLNSEIIKNLDNFDVVSSARLFESFVDDLSNWYIRRSRRRFQKPENKEEKEESSQTLYYLLLKLSKLLAPFSPFFSEELYHNLISFSAGKKESVHLAEYPESDKKRIDKKIEENMKEIRGIVVQALAQRAEAGIKVRQPIASLKIKTPMPIGRQEKSKFKINKELLSLIEEEVNVKKIIFDNKIKKEVEIDTKITKELEEEGKQREIIRQISKMRKELGLMPKDVIIVDSTISVIDKKGFLENSGAKIFNVKDKNKIEGDIKKEIIIDGQKHCIGIKVL